MFSFLEQFFLSGIKKDCIAALAEVEGRFSREPAYPLVRRKVQSTIISHHAQGAHILDYMNNKDYSPKEKTLYLVEAIALQLLSTGNYRIERDTSGREGQSLCGIYKIATEELEKCGHCDKGDKEERLTALDNVVRPV